MNLDSFLLGRQIGNGSTAVVHEALHKRSNVKVAVKILTTSGEVGDSLLDAEIRAMARLQHPNLLRILDHGILQQPLLGFSPGARWMAIDFASGGTLGRWVPRDWNAVLRTTEDLLAGLAHIHSRGLLHRDLKPANLLRCTSHDLRPGLKLSDLGLAWSMGQTDGIVRCGTPSYMAPEQQDDDGLRLGPWTDLYAVGILIWRWVCGVSPFHRKTVLATLYAHTNSPPPEFRPRMAVPKGLGRLLTLLLQKKPTDRPQSAAWVAHALRQLPHWTEEPTVPFRNRAPPPESAARTLTQGLGLALLPHREFPVVGRTSEQRRLADLLALAAAGQPQVAALSGRGSQRIATWVKRRALETAVADVFQFDGHELTQEPTGEIPMEGGVLEVLTERARPAVLLLENAWESMQMIELISTVLTHSGRLQLLIVAPGAVSTTTNVYARFDGFHLLDLKPLSNVSIFQFGRNHLGLSYDLSVDLSLHANGFVSRAIDLLRSWIDRDLLLSTPDGMMLQKGSALLPPPTPALVQRLALFDNDPDEALSVELFALLHDAGAGALWAGVLEALERPFPKATWSRLEVAELVTSNPPALAVPAVAQVWLARFERREDSTTWSAKLARAVPPELHGVRALLHLQANEHTEASRLARSALKQAWTNDIDAGGLLVQRLQQHQFAALSEHDRFVFYYARLRLRVRRDGGTAALHDLTHLLEEVQPQTSEQRAQVHLLAAHLYWRCSRFADAEQHVHLADPSPVERASHLGVILMDSGRHSEAIPHLMKAFREGELKHQVRAANGLGRMAMIAEEPGLAATWYREIERLPASTSNLRIAALNRLQALLDAGDLAGARTALEQSSTFEGEPSAAVKGATAAHAVLLGLADHDDELVRHNSHRALTYLRSDEAEDRTVLFRIANRLRPESSASREIHSALLELVSGEA